MPSVPPVAQFAAVGGEEARRSGRSHRGSEGSRRSFSPSGSFRLRRSVCVTYRVWSVLMRALLPRLCAPLLALSGTKGAGLFGSGSDWPC